MNCKNCNKEFKTKREGHVFCSGGCKSAWFWHNKEYQKNKELETLKELKAKYPDQA